MKLMEPVRDLAWAAMRQDAHGHDHGHAHGAAEAGGACSSKSCRRNWAIIFAVLLFLEGIAFGYVALLMRRFACLSQKKFRKFLHFVNAAGGGIFLATGLLHVLPEAVELASGKGHDHSSHGVNEPIEFPTGYAVALATFFVFLLFDRILLGHHGHSDHDDEVPAKLVDTRNGDEEGSDPAGSNEAAEADLDIETEEQQLNGFKSPQFMSSLVTVITLSAHSLFESIALGASKEFSGILNIFIAIATHRWATSMALGSKFAKADLGALPYSVSMILFALVAPIGVFIGIGVQNAGVIFQGIVFGISAGTFIYIGAFETVADEFVEHKKWQIPKFITMFAGAGLMVIITGILAAKRIH